MQLSKTGAELKLLAIDRQRAIRTLLSLHGVGRQALGIDRQEITHTGMLQLQVAGYAVERHDMHHVLPHATKHPLQHIVKMHTDIRSNTATLVHIALPARVVPLAATGDIRQIHIIYLLRVLCRLALHFLLQCANLVVQTKLQDSISLMTRLLLQFHQVVNIIRIQHQRLLAYHIASQTQTVTDKRIMGIVRRTDRHPLQGISGTHLFRTETVELLVLRKERTIRKTAIQSTYRVKLIICHHQVVACIGNGLNMTRCNIAGSSN